MKDRFAFTKVQLFFIKMVLSTVTNNYGRYRVGEKGHGRDTKGREQFAQKEKRDQLFLTDLKKITGFSQANLCY